MSDAGSATIKAFGILNTLPEKALGPDKDDPDLAEDVKTYVTGNRPNAAMVGMAFPGTFVLDRRGFVTSRFFEESYVERNTASSVLMRLGAAGQVAGTRISTGQLDLVAYPSDSAVAPGARFTLALNVSPRRGMHVYAPGAAGYRMVAFRAEAQPFVRMLPLKYPASELYHFKPLNERVPVYQKPFVLLQEVVLEATPEAQAALRGKEALTLRGAFEYQACDDRICFNPESIPLSWTLTLRPLVVERPVRRP